MDGIGDRAALHGVADADRADALRLEIFLQIADGTHAHREHDGLSGEVPVLAGLHVLDDDAVVADRDELRAGAELAACGDEALHLVIHELEPGAGRDLGRHFKDGDVAAVLQQELRGLQTRHAAANDDGGLVLRAHVAENDLRRGADMRLVDAGDALRYDRHTAGGEQDDVRLQLFDALDGHVHAGADRDAQLRDVRHEILDAPVELALQVAGRGGVHLSADLLALFQHRDLEAASGERLRRHQTGRTGADDHGLLPLAVPRETVVRALTSDCRVQGAFAVLADLGVRHEGRDAVQAADAALDILGASLLDLLHPVRIADEGARGADEVLISLGDLALRLLGGADEVRRAHGDGDDGFDLLGEVGAPAGLEARGLQPAVVNVIARGGDVDRVDAELFQLHGDLLAVLEAVALAGLADLVIHLVGGEAHHQRIVSAAALADALDDLGDEAHAVFKAAAVFVGAVVRVRGEELLDHVAVTAVQLHEIDARLLAAHRRLDEVVDEVFDLTLAHRVHAHRAVVGELHLAGRLHGPDELLFLHAEQEGRAFEDAVEHLREAVHDRDHERQGIRGAGIALTARVVQLDAELRAVAMDALDKRAHRLDVVVVAHGELRIGGGGAHVVDARDARDDEPHAALGALFIVIHQPLGGGAVRTAETHLRRGHHGAVLHGQRADVHRAEQMFKCHILLLLLCLLFLVAHQLLVLQLPVNIADEREDAHEHLAHGEQEARGNVFLAALDAVHHLAGDDVRLLHGERLFKLFAVGCHDEEVRVRSDGIETGHLEVVRLLGAHGLLEALGRELARAVDRVARHRHLPDGADRDGEMSVASVQVPEIAGIGVHRREGVRAEHALDALPVRVVIALIVGEARVGVEDVDLVEHALCLVEELFDALGAAHVAVEGNDVRRKARELFHRVAADGEDLVVRALLQQLQDLKTDAAARAGQNDAFSVDHMYYSLSVILSILAADVASLNFIDQNVLGPDAAIELDDADAVAAVPEPVVALRAVRRFVVDVEHILLLAGDVGDHLGGKRRLLNVPVDLVLGLPAVELRLAAGPELGEVELVILALVEELTEQLAVQRVEEDLRTSAADLKAAVIEALAGFSAHEVVRGQPYPRAREVAAPVLVRVAVAGLGLDDVLSAVEFDLAFKVALHALGVPEHLEGVDVAEELARAVADVEGDVLLDLQIPFDVAGVAHPFGVRLGFGFGDVDAAARLGLAAEAVRRVDRERRHRRDAHILPREEAVQLRLLVAPGADVDHQIARTLAALLRLGTVPDDHGLILRVRGIAGEKFHVERLFRAGLGVLGGEGMPPPVIAALGKRTLQHPLVACNIMNICHACFLPQYDDCTRFLCRTVFDAVSILPKKRTKDSTEKPEDFCWLCTKIFRNVE